MNTLKAACVQMRSGISIPENLTAMETLVRKAAAGGAQYVQTPEMTGIVQRGRKGLFESIFEPEDDPVFKRAGELACELGIWLHIGSTAVRAGTEIAANRACLFSPDGDCTATYDKIHMFDVDLDNGESWRESKVYKPGNVCRTVATPEFVLGLSICYDLRFPHLFRQQALDGAQILSVPAAFTRQTGKAHWHSLLQARAIENGAYVVAAAQGGDHEDGRETFGHSLIVNPWGEIIAEIDNEEPGVVIAELDLDQVRKARQKIPNLKNAQGFDHETIVLEDNSPAGAIA